MYDLLFLNEFGFVFCFTKKKKIRNIFLAEHVDKKVGFDIWYTISKSSMSFRCCTKQQFWLYSILYSNEHWELAKAPQIVCLLWPLCFSIPLSFRQSNEESCITILCSYLLIGNFLGKLVQENDGYLRVLIFFSSKTSRRRYYSFWGSLCCWISNWRLDRGRNIFFWIKTEESNHFSTDSKWSLEEEDGGVLGQSCYTNVWFIWLISVMISCNALLNFTCDP